jgi:AraC family transcriptional regulator
MNNAGVVTNNRKHRSPQGKFVITTLPPGSFFGQTESRRNVAEIALITSVYSHNIQIQKHEHSLSFFDLIVEGACEEIVRGQTRSRVRSTLAFHPAGEVHSSRWHGPECRCFHIEISAALLERYRQHTPFLENPALFSRGMPTWLAARLYSEFQRRDEVSPLAIEGLTMELLAESARNASTVLERKPPRWLVSVCDLLHERFREHPTLSMIAEGAGIHPAHLARTFRQIHGCTLGDHVRKLRIEFACDRITNSETPLAEIALASGFSDQSHFSRVFKRQMGMSPGEFRKSVRPRKSDATRCSYRPRTR